ncbi:MAG TPA: uroporphyrinogen-III C-methyltransferase [Phenylobacterium sp.]|nr:uroporphyrinogen-III C-methyltransferase [Phenylobacterium sp.]
MPHETGQVLLVGAGPGPADLMTVRALRAVETAQALLYDALVGREILELAPRACLRIQTGKRAGRASMRQETINRLMLRLARRGLKVVRLKGGDPSVFGRVGEESDFLRAHGVAAEIVPGVTAACAAAAQFDVPLTHRGLARRVVFATARIEGGRLADAEWARSLDAETTLALYMARDSAQAIADGLVARGLSPATPALAVESAGSPDARLLTGSLADLPGRLEAWSQGGPVLLVVGAVAARAATAGISIPDLETALG